MLLIISIFKNKITKIIITNPGNTIFAKNEVITVTSNQIPGANSNLVIEFISDNNDITLPKEIFSVLYSRKESELGTIDIIVKDDQALNSSDLVKLREIWNRRNMNDIPYINSESNFTKNIINSVGFKFNKMNRLNVKNVDYYNLLELSRYYKTSNNNEINLYSFGINPLSWKPSGYCNFSYINHFDIDISINKFEDKQYNIIIYNRYYNILNLDSGLAELIFFK